MSNFPRCFPWKISTYELQTLTFAYVLLYAGTGKTRCFGHVGRHRTIGVEIGGGTIQSYLVKTSWQDSPRSYWHELSFSHVAAHGPTVASADLRGHHFNDGRGKVTCIMLC